jgi:hypothetical protein
MHACRAGAGDTAHRRPALTRVEARLRSVARVRAVEREAASLALVAGR